MFDPFKNRSQSLSGPATELIPVTPPDNVDLPVAGVAILQVGVRRVMATGITATGIHRLAADVGHVGMRAWSRRRCQCGRGHFLLRKFRGLSACTPVEIEPTHTQQHLTAAALDLRLNFRILPKSKYWTTVRRN